MAQHKCEYTIPVEWRYLYVHEHGAGTGHLVEELPDRYHPYARKVVTRLACACGKEKERVL